MVNASGPEFTKWMTSLPDVRETIIEEIRINEKPVKKFTGEFWTSRQRQASSIHEVSYRACFKPQLPRFFIEHFTREGDVVYDPFTGRGTTIIEAALMNRNVISNDINPLSRILCRPRLFVPETAAIQKWLNEINTDHDLSADIDLSMFYHRDTFREIRSIRNYLVEKSLSSGLDDVDRWIQMVATNRLTGHSKGFFSVYTLPPNQAVSPGSQVRINHQRRQIPEYRNTKEIILKKTKDLMKNLTGEQKKSLKKAGHKAIFLTRDARNTHLIKDKTVKLTVTSPPFLDIVQYSSDNWLRCWFNNIDADEVGRKITMSRKLGDWEQVMRDVFKELYRITKNAGMVAFEVGEVRLSSIRLDEHIAEIGINQGFSCLGILVNQQTFTKTANIWGVSNNAKGTNTNRIVIFKKING